MDNGGPASNGAAGPPSRPDDGVRLVRWPEERQLLEQLRAQRVPRPLLAASAAAPVVEGCEEDWVRRPADDSDVRARMAAVAARSALHQPLPRVGPDGRLRRADEWIALSPIEHRLAQAL